MPKTKLPIVPMIAAVVALVGLAAFRFVPHPDDANECIRTTLAQHDKKITDKQLKLSGEAVKLGELTLNEKDSDGTDYREALSDQVLLSALEICRARVLGSAPAAGASEARSPLSMTFAGQVSVQVKRGSRIAAQNGVRVYSPNPHLKDCETHDMGQCNVVIEGLKSDEKLQLNAAFGGVWPKDNVTVAELLKGVTLQVQPQLPTLTVHMADCKGAVVPGKVRFDGGDIYTLGCTDLDSAECKEAPLDNGEAKFRYDAETFKKTTLIYYPPQGESAEFALDALSSVVSKVYREKDCGEHEHRNPCASTVTSKLKNEARGAAGTAAVSVSFRIVDNVVQIDAAPAAIARQLANQALQSANCSGSFTLP